MPLQVLAANPSEAATTLILKISNFANLGFISAMTLSKGISSQEKLIRRGSQMISTGTGTLSPIGLPIHSSIALGSY